MALFGLGKKKEGSRLNDQVAAMRQQGYGDDQIIQALQSHGHKSSEIYDAISQADIPSGAPSNVYPEQYPAGPAQSPQGNYAYEQPPEQPAPPPEQFQQPHDSSERVEQIAEAIIDEKWNELVKDITKITESNKEMEARLIKAEAELQNLKENFENLHKGVLGKITDYDQNLVNVGTEIKAMERVFQKILPTFTDNVNRLSRIAEGARVPAPAKKK